MAGVQLAVHLMQSSILPGPGRQRTVNRVPDQLLGQLQVCLHVGQSAKLSSIGRWVLAAWVSAAVPETIRPSEET
jgi:hypothetical protein